MFPNLDPKKMQAVMKQMGISQEEIDALRVIIEKADNTKIIIDNPSVTKVKMNGQESFQISGEISEEQGESFSEEDIKTVMEKTNASEEQARQALEETGDLAEAIMKLSI
jgi:nascent polypeptide-associated complex subunit alpha